MKFVIVWNSTLDVCSGFYESDAPDYGRFGGPIGSVTETTHLELPESLDPQCIMAVRADDGTVTLVEDPSKVAQKTAQAWRDLRSRRNQLLQQSDWTALADAHLSQAKKDAWFAYRQELRDLPDGIVDPSADLVSWPMDPT